MSKRRANKGSFKPGFDPRRHKLTRTDCWLGYAVTYVNHPELREWLRMKVRCYYAERDRKEKEVLEITISFNEPQEREPLLAGYSEDEVPW